MTSPLSAPRWFCLALGLFLLVRATTTLAAETDFATPGTGWRSVWQLVVVAVLAIGLIRPRTTAYAVGFVAAVYAAATLLELVDSTQLLGVVPVDMRDRWVHPLVALLSAWAAAADWPGRRREAPAAAV